MAEPATPQQLEGFARAVRPTRAWLDGQVAPVAASPEIEALVLRFREYLRHCRQRVDSGELTIEEIAHRKRRLEKVYYELWKALRRTRR